MKYKFTSMFFGLTVFFGLGVIDKIVAQTIWDGFDVVFTIFFSIFSAITFYNYKNAR